MSQTTRIAIIEESATKETERELVPLSPEAAERGANACRLKNAVADY
jgi:hypothetical protein